MSFDYIYNDAEHAERDERIRTLEEELTRLRAIVARVEDVEGPPATMLGPWANTEAELKRLRAEIVRLRGVIQWAMIYGQKASGGVDHDDWEDELKRKRDYVMGEG